MRPGLGRGRPVEPAIMKTSIFVIFLLLFSLVPDSTSAHIRCIDDFDTILRAGKKTVGPSFAPPRPPSGPLQDSPLELDAAAISTIQSALGLDRDVSFDELSRLTQEQLTQEQVKAFALRKKGWASFRKAQVVMDAYERLMGRPVPRAADLNVEDKLELNLEIFPAQISLHITNTALTALQSHRITRVGQLVALGELRLQEYPLPQINAIRKYRQSLLRYLELDDIVSPLPRSNGARHSFEGFEAVIF